MKSRPHLQNRFREVVIRLSLRKAGRLLRLVERGQGKAAKFTRKWRNRKIEQLKAIVEEVHLPELRRWVRKNTRKAEVRFLGRTAKNDKAIEVKDRLSKHWGRQKHLSYCSFNTRRKCLKVGRSDIGLKRIAGQYAMYYFRDASRVVVYFPRRRRKKTLPRLECALTHVYRPYHLYQWPALSKYKEKCPACRDAKIVERQVRKLFPA